ncbi:MAG: alpha/beta fold hydrolase [Hyphomonadaceae bacterium]
MRWIIGGLLAVIGLAAILGAGAYFALKRPDLPYETLAATYESSASRYVELDGGIRVHYRDEGRQEVDAPVLVLVHGFSASLHTWEPWVARLGDQYRIISLDLPGHGLTRAPAGYRPTMQMYRDVLAAFVDDQAVDRFALAGSSMGGHVAWEYALEHPDRLSALILVDAAGWPDPRVDNTEEPAIFKLLRNPVLGPILRDLDNSRLIRQGLEASFYDPALVDDAMLARYAELARAPGHRDILLHLSVDRSARTLATPERLAPIRTPTLILQGDTDRLVPMEAAQAFKDAIAGSELIVFEQTGHIPQEEKPDESAEVVRAFLNRVAPPAPAPQPCAADAPC